MNTFSHGGIPTECPQTPWRSAGVITHILKEKALGLKKAAWHARAPAITGLDALVIFNLEDKGGD